MMIRSSSGQVLPRVLRCRFLLIIKPVFSSFDFKMLNHQLLTLTILSMLNHDVQAGKNKFVRSKGHLAPEYASGPNGTMTKVDYINQFRSICDDLKVQTEANNAIHAQFKDLFETVVVSSQPTNGSVDCTLSRIFRNDTTMFVPTDKDLQERVKEVKHCLVNEKDTELLKKFVALYEAEYMLNAKVRIELFTAYGLKGLVLFKPVNKTYFNTSDPYTHFQYGCKIDDPKNDTDEMMEKLQYTFTFMMNESISGLHEANFTEEKKETFEDIQFYINNTFDALSDLIDYANSNALADQSMESEKSYVTNGAKFHDEPEKKKPRLAKMEMITENPLPFNPLLILLGSITALVIVAATMALVLCLKKSKKNDNFQMRRLKEEDPEANETNPANAVLWSLENDQLTLIRK